MPATGEEITRILLFFIDGKTTEPILPWINGYTASIK